MEELTGPVVALCGKNTAKYIAMTAEILRAGVHDQIRAEEERILETRRCERAIDDEVCAARVCFLCVRSDVEGGAFGVDGGFEEDDVALLEVVGVAVEVEFLQARETGEEGDYAVAAMVAFADGDAAGVKEGEGCVEGGETGGVGDCFAVEEGGEDGFEAGWVGAGEARIDVVGGIDVGLYDMSQDGRREIRQRTVALTM